MIKKIVRKEYLRKRLQLSKEDLAERTFMIVNNFMKIKLPSLQFLLSYSPMKRHNEFDITLCECIVKEKFPAAVIAWPKADTIELSMHAHTPGSESSFIENKFGIPEPVEGDRIIPTLIDLVFVPLIAFDKKGYRVGYGKGFYDRYLTNCRADAMKLGFSFFEPVEAIEDINAFDVPLNFCVTPNRVYEF
jgi:5-formyltetrahydrofolate cyclo-ligase